jgi:hypothetical protein
MSKLLRQTLTLAAIAVAFAPPAIAEAPCTPIHFAAGQFSATVNGMAPATDVVCYSMATGSGQQATLKIVKGANTVFTIDGVIDAQDSYSFKTDKKTYRILIGQLMRSDTPEAFDLGVTIK